MGLSYEAANFVRQLHSSFEDVFDKNQKVKYNNGDSSKKKVKCVCVFKKLPEIRLFPHF